MVFVQSKMVQYKVIRAKLKWYMVRNNPTMTSSCELAMRGLILCLNKLRLDSSSLLLLRFTGIILEDMVHLLKGAAFGLRYEEESPNSGKHAEDGEEDIGAVSGILNEGWCDKTLLMISDGH